MNTKIFDIILYPIQNIDEKFNYKPNHIITANSTGYLSFVDDNKHDNNEKFEMLILSDNKIHLDDLYIDDAGNLRKSIMIYDESYWKHRQNYRKVEASMNLNTIKIPEDLILKYRQYFNQNRGFDVVKIQINNIRYIKADNLNFIKNYSLLSDEKMYSENEIHAILEKYDNDFKLDTFAYTKSCSFTVTEWFNKIKKPISKEIIQTTKIQEKVYNKSEITKILEKFHNEYGSSNFDWNEMEQEEIDELFEIIK